MLKRYVIQREVPGIGAMNDTELGGAAKQSNAALAELAPRVQWEHSYVADGQTFCIYLAEDMDAIRKHAEISGFPANVMTEIKTVIDPTTANRAH